MKFKLIAKILSCFIITLMLSTSVFAANVSNNSNDEISQAVNSLVNLGVISKADASSYSTDGTITKAEFLKMVTIALNKEDEATVSSGPTIFSDVSGDYWANGYINVAVKNKIVTGYADGTFRPDEEINYAQAITILLRILGYDSNSMTGIWPQNYFQKANSLDITKGINFQLDSKLTKKDAVLMIFRTISTDTNGSTKTLAEVSDLGSVKTAIIIDSSDLDQNLPQDVVKTDSGDLKSRNFNGLSYLGKKVDLIVDKDSNILAVSKVDFESKTLFVNNISSNQINYSSGSGEGTINIADNMTFYYNGLKQTFKDVKSNIVQGSVVSLGIDSDTGKYAYGVLINRIVSDPVVAVKDIDSSDKNIGNIDISNRDNYIVIRNGETGSFSDIKMYDVVYKVYNPFNQNKGIILVYDNKITGTYDEALPDKNSVNKISLSGQTLEIDSSAAVSKLNDSSSAFAIDDEITVLTGINGKIVDVVSPNSMSLYDIAIVINTRKGNVTPLNATDLNNDGDTDTATYYAKLYKADGTIVEYQTDDDYSNDKGQVVRFGLYKGIANIIPVNTTQIYGAVDKGDKMIGDNWVSTSASILDVNNDPSSNNDILVNKVDWNELPTTLTRDKVIDAERGGDFGDVQLLVLSNLFGTQQYGILMADPTGTNQKTFSISLNGVTKVYTGGNSNSITPGVKGDVVYVDASGSTLRSLSLLVPTEKSDTIQAIDLRRIKINNEIYRLDNNVQIYDVGGSQPAKISRNDLKLSDIKYAAIYVGYQTNVVKIITIINK